MTPEEKWRIRLAGFMIGFTIGCIIFGWLILYFFMPDVRDAVSIILTHGWLHAIRTGWASWQSR